MKELQPLWFPLFGMCGPLSHLVVLCCIPLPTSPQALFVSGCKPAPERHKILVHGVNLRAHVWRIAVKCALFPPWSRFVSRPYEHRFLIHIIFVQNLTYEAQLFERMPHTVLIHGDGNWPIFFAYLLDHICLWHIHLCFIRIFGPYFCIVYVLLKWFFSGIPYLIFKIIVRE